MHEAVANYRESEQLRKAEKAAVTSRCAAVLFPLLAFLYYAIPLARGIAVNELPRSMFYCTHLVLVGILAWTLVAEFATALVLYCTVVALEAVAMSTNTMLDATLNLFFLAGAICLFIRSGARRFPAEAALAAVAGLAFAFPALTVEWRINLKNFYWMLRLFSAGFLFAAFRESKSLFPPRKLLLLNLALSLTVVAVLSLAAARSSGFIEDLLSMQSGTRLGNLDSVGGNSFSFLMVTGALCWLGFWAEGGSVVVGGAGCLTCLVPSLMSRTITTNAIGLVAVSFVLIWTQRPCARFVRAIALAGVVLIAILGSNTLVNSASTYLGLENKDYVTLSRRTILWENAAKMVTENPLGVSWRQYEQRADQRATYESAYQGAESEVLTPHNAILGAFVFAGLIGGVAFLIMHLMLVTNGLRKVAILTQGRVFYLVPLVAVCVHLVIDDWFFIYYVLLSWLLLPIAPKLAANSAAANQAIKLA